MSFVEKINQDISEAMRAKDQDRLGPLRMLKAALMNKKVERGKDVTDGEAQQVVSTLVKQRKDSVEQFTNARFIECVEPSVECDAVDFLDRLMNEQTEENHR